MERVNGIVVTDLNRLREKQVNLRKLAHLGVEIFFTQVFEDNFFHADMHPGNVLVDASDPENPTYIALDCAIIGVLNADDQKYLARNLLAFFNADYRAVAIAHIESGWVPADTDIDAFEKVIADVCRPIFGKPMREIKFAGLLIELFNTAREFNLVVQPQLVLLQKTLLNIEGIGRQVYADLDLWETAAPFMTKWMKKQTGWVHIMEELKALGPAALAELPDLPRNLLFAAREIKQISLNQRQQARLLTTLKSDLQHFHRFSRRARLTTLGLGLALGFAVIPGLQLNLDQGLLIGTIILGTIALYLVISRP
jgi:ubiquinone biosynthesis protein